MKKTVTVFILAFSLIFVFASFPQIGLVKAESTIYIREDGSVEGRPDSIQRDGDVYTLTGDISGGITVQRDFTVIDGAGYTVRGHGEGGGIELGGCVNVTVQNIQIINFTSGVRIIGTRHIIIKNNTFVNNTNPISIAYSEGGGHVITENIFIDGTFIIIWLSSQPTVDRNYWDDYNGTDADGDGIGDTPYVYGGDQETKYMDYHPLMEPAPIIPEFPPSSPSPESTTTPSPAPSPTPVLTPEHTPSPEPTSSPEPQQPEPFPTVPIAAASVSTFVVCVGLLVYFKKRKL